MSDAEVGDVVKLTWPAQKIEKIVMRVTAVDLGAPTDGAVRLTLIQDVFGVFESFYTTGSEAHWQKPSFEPLDVTRLGCERRLCCHAMAVRRGGVG